jgi:hypothetical protein
MAEYKVFFHVGDELGIKTRVEKGTASLNETTLSVDGPGGLSLPMSSIQHVNLFRLHGLGRVIQIDHAGGRLFVSVVRFMIGQFASINFFKTGDLNERLIAATTRTTTTPTNN